MQDYSRVISLNYLSLNISQLSGVPTAISVFDVATESFNTQKELDEVRSDLFYYRFSFLKEEILHLINSNY